MKTESPEKIAAWHTQLAETRAELTQLRSDNRTTFLASIRVSPEHADSYQRTLEAQERCLLRWIGAAERTN